jgi:hypothetical protein
MKCDPSHFFEENYKLINAIRNSINAIGGIHIQQSIQVCQSIVLDKCRFPFLISSANSSFQLSNAQ